MDRRREPMPRGGLPVSSIESESLVDADMRLTSMSKWHWAIFRREGMREATGRPTTVVGHANFGIWVKSASTSESPGGTTVL